MANEIISELILDLDKFKASLKEAEKIGLDSGKKAGESIGGGIESSFKNLGSTLLKLAGPIAAAFGLKHIIEEGVGAQKAIDDLNFALRVSGQYSEAASQDLQNYAQSLSHVTKYSQTSIIAGEALLMNLGKLSGQGLKEATAAALDLATRTGDITTAFQLVEKAANGQIGGLKRLGLDISATGDKAIDFARAMRTIQDTLGGKAQEEATTFSGALSRVSKAFLDILENIGKLIINDERVISFINSMADGFEFLANNVEKAGGMLSKAANWISTLGGLITDTSGIGMGGAAGSATYAAEAMTAFGTDTEKTAQRVINAVNAMALSTDENLNRITTDQVAKQMTDLDNKVKITSQSIAQRLNQDIVNGFANAGAAIGGALAKGENAFEAFGKSVLKALGSILIQFGSMLIAVGIGLSTVPMLFGLSGPAAIAAGVAATILGGAMMALGGGGGGSSAPTATGGGVAADTGGGGAPRTDVGQISTGEIAKPGTQVQVNIQGHVLDRRQTGLEIVDILNESFNNGGTQLAVAGGV